MRTLSLAVWQDKVTTSLNKLENPYFFFFFGSLSNPKPSYEHIRACRSLLPPVASGPWVSWVNVTVGGSLMWAERLPCWLSCLLSGWSRGSSETVKRGNYRQRSCCLITFFLPFFSVFYVTNGTLCYFCTLSFIYKRSGGVVLETSDFSRFLSRKKKKNVQMARTRTCKDGMDARMRMAHAKQMMHTV